MDQDSQSFKDAKLTTDEVVTSGEQIFSIRPILKVVFATLSLILLFYITQSQIGYLNQYLEEKKRVLALATQKVGYGFPVRLKIPKINVDTNVQHVGVNTEGEMEVPSNTVDVGWFNMGPHPGDTGSSVIAGHFDGENGEPAVFTNLNKLKAGDEIYVEDDGGRLTAFVVRESHTYKPGFAEEVFSSNDTAHLNLVTCDGIWDGTKKSFSKRLVVFADIKPEN